MVGTILVVAPDSAFRLSLRFMLETEGFDVVVPDSVEEALRLRADADCMIVDHDILIEAGMPVARLAADDGPFVLLADTLQEMPQAEHMRTVEKPLLGSAVVNAVQALLEGAGRREKPALRRFP
ncbi:DNA-binding response regulator [Nitratireductor rhodophyticola]|uniref:DNA-binding response regulator n=1 Tax=Nitratireductor rhodophyticola TaxID=2854036 RepID=UPI000A54F7F9|nr:DNA-binding response regulator [Nitratireductor rhodophyticola]MEC9247191.1 DNA-binding response regulator [Pseudomonadota bacterium]WPZ14424.1 DNA-binding response regulator [Nitratireductor rhodophyticola]